MDARGTAGTEPIGGQPTALATFSVDSIEDVVAAIAAGQMVVVVDDDSDDCEGVVLVAAEDATPQVINFLSRRAGGWMGLALTHERCDALDLAVLPARHERYDQAPFTMTFDARRGIGRGTSLADRARSIAVAVDPAATAEDIVVPGHIHPLRARQGGVLERAGHTEAAVDLVGSAGRAPAGVICSIQTEEGTQPSLDELRQFADEHDLRIVRIADIIALRRRRARVVQRVAEATLATRFGEFRAVGFQSLVDDLEHLALVKGDISGDEPPLVRVHTQCLLGDAFHGLTCDCRESLTRSLEIIERQGRGVVLHLAQPAHGLGLLAGGHGAPDDGSCSPPIELRQVGVGAGILVDLGLRDIRLLTDHPHRLPGLEGYGLNVVEQVPIAEL